MISAEKPANESQRLDALRGYRLLDTGPEGAFDALTKLATNLFDVPIAVVSLIDENFQLFKSQCGLDGVTSTGRDVALCAHAILGRTIFEIPDTLLDPRFADNPLVTGYPNIRFYAGMPLVDPSDMPLGTLCLIDRRPRSLSQAQHEQLKYLAQAVLSLMLARHPVQEPQAM